MSGIAIIWTELNGKSIVSKKTMKPSQTQIKNILKKMDGEARRWVMLHINDIRVVILHMDTFEAQEFSNRVLVSIYEPDSYVKVLIDPSADVINVDEMDEEEGLRFRETNGLINYYPLHQTVSLDKAIEVVLYISSNFDKPATTVWELPAI